VSLLLNERDAVILAIDTKKNNDILCQYILVMQLWPKEGISSMQRDQIVPRSNQGRSPGAARAEKQSPWSAILAWWYRLAAPPEPPATASHSQRERVRRGRQASITMAIYMCFLLVLVLRVITSNNPALMITQLIGLVGCVLALFLNRRGFVEVAGILILVLVYIAQTVTILNAPGGLTVSGLPMLDFSVLPDILALAFFSANSLFLIVCINILQAWAILMYGPHDAGVTQLLQTASSQTFSHIYDLQLITAAALYVGGRSVEYALARADRAEEIAAFEKREKERQEQELEQKRQLDAGIQAILQTHVAVANGDLNARAPLHRDHMLWQVAVALNNLIARHQSLSHAEHEIRRQVQKENRRVADRQTGKMPKADGSVRQSQEGKS
jgi:hypothetical protein